MTRSLHPRVLRMAVLAAATCSVLAPAPAQAAPAVTTPDRCYIHWPGEGSQPIPVALSGLAPGQQVRVELKIRGITVSGLPMLTADGNGAVVTQLRTWTSGLEDGPSRGVGASIVVSDLAAGTQLAATPARVANAGLDIDSATRRNGTKRRWIVSGLSRLGGNRNYWAFYYKGTRLVGKQRLGRANECGYLRTRAQLIPFVKVGKYELRVQASRTFRKSLPWIGGSVEQKRARPRR